MDKLYSKEQIQEWASKRADDAGRLSRQLLDTMRENDLLRKLVDSYALASHPVFNNKYTPKGGVQSLILDEPYKHSDYKNTRGILAKYCEEDQPKTSSNDGA